MVRNPVLKIHGTRGSISAARPEYMGYGGDTSSYTLRTPANTLIFIEAGTGIIEALDELQNVADKVVLAVSHTHADHISGLALPNERGVQPLIQLSQNPGYKDKKVELYCPKRFMDGFKRYYDGEFVWPVTPSMMNSIDLEGRIEVEDGGSYPIDDSTQLRVMYGNHPVASGPAFFRFDIKTSTDTKSVVSATDGEFDYIGVGKPNPKREELTEKYINFIMGFDILIADSMYEMMQYARNFPKNTQGFGHAYHEQIMDLAARASVRRGRAGVKRVVLSHHDRYSDEYLGKLDRQLREEGRKKGLEVMLAKPDMVFELA